MSNDSSSRNNALLLFFGGAALGALTVAFFTPRARAQAREDLASLGRRIKGKAGHLAHRSTQAWNALQGEPADPHPASGQDLRGQAAGAWQDVKDVAERLVTDVKQLPAEVAKDFSE